MNVLILYAHHSRHAYLEFFLRSLCGRSTQVPYTTYISNPISTKYDLPDDLMKATYCREIKTINMGRDFCIWSQMLEEVNEGIINKHTHLFFINDTCTGPFCDHWLERYKTIFEHETNIGIIGPTISPLHIHKFPEWHVQTYCFMIPLTIFKELRDRFFIVRDLDREESIELEVGLSQTLLTKGYHLASTASINSRVAQMDEFSEAKKHRRCLIHHEPIEPHELIFSKYTNPRTGPVMQEMVFPNIIR